MEIVGGGRHCAACQKTVQDFSAFSDRDLANWLSSYDGGAICGRLRADQLERPIQPVQVRSEQSRNGNWVRWAVALVLGWQTAKGQTSAARSNNSPATLSPIQPKAGLVSGLRPLISPEPVLYVTGQVVDGDGKPYSRAIVQNESAGVSVVADGDGKFRLPIYASDQKKDSIRVSMRYDDRQYVNVSTKQEQPPLRLTVNAPAPRHDVVGGGLLVIRQDQPKRRSFWQFLTGKR